MDGPEMHLPKISNTLFAHRLHHPGNVAVCMMLVAVWALSGCSTITGTSQSSLSGAATNAPTVAPTVTRAKINDAASSPCPVTQAPGDVTSFKPDITVTEDGGSNQALTVRRGQRLEIRLAAQVQWEMQVDDPNHTLLDAASEGWYDSVSHACVWRFVAANAGNARLSYIGSIVCPPLELCPAVEHAVSYQVTVQ
jgi:hypothetical protein